MMGNVHEWMESPYTSGDYGFEDSHSRAWRGGSYLQDDAWLPSSYRHFATPDLESTTGGFRVASVPEPCSLGLLALGGLAILKRRRH